MQLSRGFSRRTTSPSVIHFHRPFHFHGLLCCQPGKHFPSSYRTTPIPDPWRVHTRKVSAFSQRTTSNVTLHSRPTQHTLWSGKPSCRSTAPLRKARFLMGSPTKPNRDTTDARGNGVLARFWEGPRTPKVSGTRRAILTEARRSQANSDGERKCRALGKTSVHRMPRSTKNTNLEICTASRRNGTWESFCSAIARRLQCHHQARRRGSSDQRAVFWVLSCRAVPPRARAISCCDTRDSIRRSEVCRNDAATAGSYMVAAHVQKRRRGAWKGTGMDPCCRKHPSE